MHSHREGFYPVLAPRSGEKWTGKIHPAEWVEVAEKCKTGSQRQIASEYGVSHEAVRRTLREAEGLMARKVR